MPPTQGQPLGHQLIAEGKSMMTKENYHRFPDDEKVKGIDYKFYRELLAGKFDEQINEGLDPISQQKPGVYSDALIKA